MDLNVEHSGSRLRVTGVVANIHDLFRQVPRSC
jgi:hypothetical protein